MDLKIQLLAILLMGAISSCTPKSIFVSEKKTDAPPATPPAQSTTGSNAGSKEVVDYEKRCGISFDSSEGEDPIMFAQNLKSLPIVVQTDKLGLSVKIILTAVASVVSKKSGTSYTQTTTVDTVQVDGNSPIIARIGKFAAEIRAKSDAEKNTGPKDSTGLSIAEWLNLTVENVEFKNLVCGIQATKKVIDGNGGEVGEVEFIPALPNVVNLKAPKETLESEIGTGRVFNVKANIIKSKSTWPKGMVNGTVTIRPVTPILSAPNGKTYTSDIAYEIKVDFAPKPGKIEKPSFATHQTIYINTKTKSITALIDESITTLEDGTKMPRIILLPE
jgi:hypothetical protein